MGPIARLRVERAKCRGALGRSMDQRGMRRRTGARGPICPTFENAREEMRSSREPRNTDAIAQRNCAVAYHRTRVGGLFFSVLYAFLRQIIRGFVSLIWASLCGPEALDPLRWDYF